MEIASRIHTLRLEHKLTVEALAAQLGIEAQVLADWESGTAEPALAQLPALAAALGVSIDALFVVDDDTHTARIRAMLDDKHIPDADIAEQERRYLLEQARKNPGSTDALLLLAQLENHIAEGYQAQAARYAAEALDRDPDCKRGHTELVKAMNGRRTDWWTPSHENLVSWYADFFKRHPESHTGYLWLLDQLIDDQRTDEAQTYVQQMAQFDHTFRVPLYYGSVLWCSGDRQQAQNIWNKMGEVYGEDWTVWYSMGGILARIGQLEDAKAYYRHAYEMHKYLPTLEASARISEQQGLYGEAISTLHEYLRDYADQWGTEADAVTEGINSWINRLKGSYSKQDHMH